MNKFNKADKVLCIAFIIFLIFLGLKLYLEKNIVIELGLFCAEAALVGGIADWFAVTALFKKPLGFPFHTALLPARRKIFVNSCVDMIRKEFMSKRSVYKMIEKSHLLDEGLIYLKKDKNKRWMVEKVIRYLVDYVRDYSDIEMKSLAYSYSRIANDFIENVELQPICDDLLKDFKEKRDIDLSKLTIKLKNYLDGEQGYERILAYVDQLASKYSKEGFTSNLTMFFATTLNAFNSEDLAKVIHARLIELLDKSLDKDSEVYKELLSIVYEALDEVNKNEHKMIILNTLRAEFIKYNVLEKVIYRSLKSLQEHFASDIKDNRLQKVLQDALIKEIDACIERLKTNRDFKEKINIFIMNAVQNAALKGEDIILETARKFLEGLTDEKLNELVYSKVETDLIWIRLNGSIVGCVIGFIIFWLIELVRLQVQI